MVKTRADIWLAADPEGAYAGGDQCAANAQNPWTTAASMTALDHVISAGVFQILYDRVEIAGINGDEDPTLVVATKKEFKDPPMEQYVQTADQWNLAFEDIGIGNTPTSWGFHQDNAIQEHQSYGCFIMSYELTFAADDFCKQLTTWGYNNAKNENDDGLAPLDTSKAFQTVAPAVGSDVALTIEGDAAPRAKSGSLKVEHTLHFLPDVGSFNRTTPVLLKSMYTFSVTFLSDTLAGNLDGKKTVEAVAGDIDFIVTVTLAGANITQTFAGFYLESITDGELNEDDIREWTAVLKNGSAFVIS